MDRKVKIKWCFLAAIACAALAGGASLAAERGGKSAPKSGEAISQQEGLPSGHLPDPVAAANKTRADTAGQNSRIAGNRNDAENVTARPFAVSNGRSAKGGRGEAGIESGGKSAARGIDLIRPDDGYAGLRRRATRSSIIAAGQKKKFMVVSPVALTPHQLSPASTPVEPLRNSAGVAVPVSTGLGKPDSTVNAGLAKTGARMSSGEIHRSEIHLTATGAMAPVTGINGTTMGHTGAGGVGGPAKNRSAINGSAFHH